MPVGPPDRLRRFAASDKGSLRRQSATELAVPTFLVNCDVLKHHGARVHLESRGRRVGQAQPAMNNSTAIPFTPLQYLAFCLEMANGFPSTRSITETDPAMAKSFQPHRTCCSDQPDPGDDDVSRPDSTQLQPMVESCVQFGSELLPAERRQEPAQPQNGTLNPASDDWIRPASDWERNDHQRLAVRHASPSVKPVFRLTDQMKPSYQKCI